MENIKVFDVFDVYDAVNRILSEYKKNDICIQELLNSISITELSVNDTVRVYAILSKAIDEDVVVRYVEDGPITLYEDNDLKQISI